MKQLLILAAVLAFSAGCSDPPAPPPPPPPPAPVVAAKPPAEDPKAVYVDICELYGRMLEAERISNLDPGEWGVFARAYNERYQEIRPRNKNVRDIETRMDLSEMFGAMERVFMAIVARKDPAKHHAEFQSARSAAEKRMGI